MNIGMIMGGLVKAAQDLTELRVESESPFKEKALGEIDVTKPNKEYEDDDSDEDFNDVDEEVNEF